MLGPRVETTLEGEGMRNVDRLVEQLLENNEAVIDAAKVGDTFDVKVARQTVYATHGYSPAEKESIKRVQVVKIEKFSDGGVTLLVKGIKPKGAGRLGPNSFSFSSFESSKRARYLVLSIRRV